MECSIKNLSKYRFESSVEALEDARIMYQAGRYKNALNRAYYSIFHSLRSVNVLDGFDSSKHSGVIAYFNQNYVKWVYFQKKSPSLLKWHLKNENLQIIWIFLWLLKKKHICR